MITFAHYGCKSGYSPMIQLQVTDKKLASQRWLLLQPLLPTAISRALRLGRGAVRIDAMP